MKEFLQSFLEATGSDKSQDEVFTVSLVLDSDEYEDYLDCNYEEDEIQDLLSFLEISEFIDKIKQGFMKKPNWMIKAEKESNGDELVVSCKDEKYKELFENLTSVFVKVSAKESYI